MTKVRVWLFRLSGTGCRNNRQHETSPLPVPPLTAPNPTGGASTLWNQRIRAPALLGCPFFCYRPPFPGKRPAFQALVQSLQICIAFVKCSTAARGICYSKFSANRPHRTPAALAQIILGSSWGSSAPGFHYMTEKADKYYPV